MASGTIPIYQPMIKYKDITIESLTFDNPGSSNWKDVRSYKPSGMNNFLFALIKRVNSYNGDSVAIFLDGLGEWLGGQHGKTVTNLEIRYFYTD